MKRIQLYARIGGVLFVASLVGGGFGEFYAPTQLIVPGDAAATAHNVVTSGALLRGGFAGYIVEALCDTALAAFWYVMLRPVSRAIALNILVFHLMATATFAFSELFYVAPALMLSGDSYLKGFSPDQLNSLALLSFNMYGFGGTFSEVFYGLASIGVGYLMYRSGYLPRLLGVVWIIGGVGFAVEVFAAVLVPGIDSTILRLPTIVGILLTLVWLLARGVDAPKWEARTATAGAL